MVTVIDDTKTGFHYKSLKGLFWTEQEFLQEANTSIICSIALIFKIPTMSSSTSTSTGSIRFAEIAEIEAAIIDIFTSTVGQLLLVHSDEAVSC